MKMIQIVQLVELKSFVVSFAEVQKKLLIYSEKLSW